ncbi:MAG: radical SAM protein [Bacteroidetes bacterium]|nr:radical SAM protein [Bacteroidota bacterium]
MSGFLFHEVVFGPVRSRRLGLSLGINLLPLHSKHCSFNCIYCECGWTKPDLLNQPMFPSREEVAGYLEQRLIQLVDEHYIPDAITYAGNGEPTMHPDFAGIVDDTLALRDKFVPGSKVTVLSNASMLDNESVFGALQKLDNNILKLDAGNEKMFNLINNPVEPIRFESLIGNLKKFNGNLIIQSMFLRGRFKGESVDNTTSAEVEKWLESLVEIKPKMVMIYPIARETPVHNLEKIALPELEKIASRVTLSGIKAVVYQ